MKLSLVSLILVLLFSVVSGIYSQDTDQHETNWEVQELWDFHDVIFKIWHEAWPAKDTKMLIVLVPEIESGFANLKKVELPGILREKQEKWQTGIREMSEIIEKYKEAAKTTDEKSLLDEAEKLHAKFEFLVRTIKPVIPEVDEFHKVLYVLYHYNYPEFDLDKIKESVKLLNEKMDDLNNAKLSKRHEAKQEKFNAVREKLAKSVNDLVNVLNTTSNKETITKSIEEMHTKYQDLEQVFD